MKGLFVSLLIHLGMLLFLASQDGIFPRLPAEPVQIEIVEPDPSTSPKAAPVESRKTKQIVSQVLVPENQLRPQDETLADFLSQKKQRVEKQMKASESGPSKNLNRLRSKDLAKEVLQQKKLGVQFHNFPNLPKGEGLDLRKGKDKGEDSGTAIDGSQNANRGERRSTVTPPQLSSISENISDSIEMGSMTALNTDSYLYYSFFARVQELVRFRWTSRVETAKDLMDGYYLRNVVQGRDWTTHLDIWLTPKGEYHSAHIMKESGVKLLDRAAVMAFKEVQIFSNPPQELVEDDGFIHLRYNLTVRFRNQY